MKILVSLNVMLAKRRMTLVELSEKTGITMAALSLMKNGKGKGIRYSSLGEICTALECTPNDILELVSEEEFEKLINKRSVE